MGKSTNTLNKPVTAKWKLTSSQVADIWIQIEVQADILRACVRRKQFGGTRSANDEIQSRLMKLDKHFTALAVEKGTQT